ncbi:hypothetical protein ACHAWF_012791 [Thalassiosira exigua]
MVLALEQRHPSSTEVTMLRGDEKKSGSPDPPPPPPPPRAAGGGPAGATPNPLASLAPLSVPTSPPTKAPPPTATPTGGPAAAAGAASPTGGSSAASTAADPVPNPILSSGPLPPAPAPAPPPAPSATTTPVQYASFACGGGGSLVPSPLATPILSPSNAAVATYACDPPERPSSTATDVVGLEDAMADAMATAMDSIGEELGDGDGEGEGGEGGEPPAARRRRANTIHWDDRRQPGQLQQRQEQRPWPSPPQQQQQHPQRPWSAGALSPGDETLQPVNFGDSSPQEAGQPRVRKMSTASWSTSMGLRTTSSGSLFSEHSGDSGSAGMGSPIPGSFASSGSLPQFNSYAGVASAGGAPGAMGAAAKFAPGAAAPPVDKRRKRLERNRESARASRRRRKHYLEELEARVTSTSAEMDRGRIDHAAAAVRTVRSLRAGTLREAERGLAPPDGASRKPLASRGGIRHDVRARPGPAGAGRGAGQGRSPFSTTPSSSAPAQTTGRRSALLVGALSRATDQLQIVQTFLKMQLTSLVQPVPTKFALWLTLQPDEFFRGGRSASERLSAARIGERLLYNGTYRAAPCEGMWPLTCHEIGLSYDQEDRIRQCQRSVLANGQSWVHRHTALAARSVVEGLHDAMGGAQQAARRRERSLMGVLTPEQRVKFLAWANRRSHDVRRLAEARIGPAPVEEYQTSPDRHVAANLYVVNHWLSKVKQRAPPDKPDLVHPSKLTKLGRRPSFESLAGHQSESEGSSKLNRDTSFPSTGSLKRSLNDALGVDNFANDPNAANPPQSGTKPEAAQAASHAAVVAALKDVLPIVPALKYAPNLHHPVQPPQAVLSQPQPTAMVTSQPRPMLQGAAVSKPKYQQRRHSTLSMPPNVPSAVAQVTSAPTDPDVVDIPMPTPVSVLMSTSDDFISPYRHEEPLRARVVAFAPAPTGGPVVDLATPESVTSYATGGSGVMGSGLLGSRHQSAPQLSLGGSSPSPDLAYPSMRPAPMAAIPEWSNPSVMGAAGGGNIADFALEDFPEMAADDWAIGEGFDMDVDEGAR